MASGLDKYIWAIIKQIILAEFEKSIINVTICQICHTDDKKITNNWKTNEHENVLNITRFISDTNNTNNKILPNINNIDHKIHTVYNNHIPGENVVGDGSCGIYALCNALNDGHKNITTISEILHILGLTKLPNYWWADDELASLANYYGFDTYIMVLIKLEWYIVTKTTTDVQQFIKCKQKYTLDTRYKTNKNTYYIYNDK